MATTHKVQAVVGLSGFETQFGGVTIQRERIARLEIPQAVNPDHIRRMQRDLEILSKMAREYPTEWVELHNAVLDHNFSKANQIAEKIGLNEHKITSQGGGLNVVIIGIAVAAAVLLSSDSNVHKEE